MANNHPPNKDRWLIILSVMTKRRTIAAFIISFLILECALFLVYEKWLPAPSTEHEGMRLLAASSSAKMPRTRQHRHKNEMIHPFAYPDVKRVVHPAAISQSNNVRTIQKQQQQHRPVPFQPALTAPRGSIQQAKANPRGLIKGSQIMNSSNNQPRVVQNLNGNMNANPKNWNPMNVPKTMLQTKINQNMMAAKKQPRGWDPGAQGRNKDPMPLKVETPIFVASLPKSGTTSIWQYFNCGARSSSHQWIKTQDGTSMQSGLCIRTNIWEGKAPFENCGEYNVYSDSGFATFVSEGVSDCYYPSIHGLPMIYKHYPNATIIMIARNSTAWLNSMQAWDNGSLLLRWKNCKLAAHLTPTPDDPDAFRAFYEWHTQHVRDFAAQHPSMKYIEVSLESPLAGHVLEQEIGIPASCWGICTPYSKYCQPIISASG